MDTRVIVDTMTLPEIVSLAKEERVSVRGRLSRLGGSYRREIIQRRPKGELYFTPVSWKSASGITYHSRFFVHSYADYKRGGVSFTLYGTFLWRGGIFTLFAVNNLSDFVIYTPHFFSRYRERFLKEEEILPVIDRYFRNNDISSIRRQPGTESGVFATTREGVSLGEEEDGVPVFKTYISEELLREDQTEIRDQEILRVINQYRNNDLTKQDRI